MSPTIFRHRGYRVFFFSREEERMHVHVSCAGGEAKFWLEPVIALADFTRQLSRKQLREMQDLVEERSGEIQKAWKAHFGARN